MNNKEKEYSELKKATLKALEMKKVKDFAWVNRSKIIRKNSFSYYLGACLLKQNKITKKDLEQALLVSACFVMS